jgi:hypothetical protein
MASTIAAQFVPDIQNPYIQERSTTLAALWRSGLVVPNADLQGQLNTNAGNQFITPFLQSIEDTTNFAVGSYNPDDKIAKQRLASSDYRTNATTRAASYTLSDIQQIITGQNGVEVFRNQLGDAWTNQYQGVLIAQTLGLIADNVANDGADMVTDLWADTASPAASNLISSSAVINARHQMGDARAALRVIIMHSIVRKQLELDEPTNFIPNSASNIGFDTYLGMVIIEDDGMTVNQDGSTDTGKYSTFLFGGNVFQYADYKGWSTLEWDRDITSGNGTGEDFLVSRSRFICHPQGFDMLNTNNYDFPSDADYALAANWDRKVASRKQVAIAVLYTNAV